MADFGPTNAFNEDRNGDVMVWRITPEGKKTEWITGFGEGDLDTHSIYVTTTHNGGRGGKIWRIPVGIEGQPVIRVDLWAESN